MRIIAIEEHYATPTFMAGPGRGIAEQAEAAKAHPTVAAGFDRLVEQLCDLGDQRIAEMDAAGIDVQVLSLTTPGVEQADPADAVKLARDSNDQLAAAVGRHPDRFAGFAALPTGDPAAAADELTRTVRDHGFKGALINGHTRGRYLDDEFFWPIMERAEALDVPIYLHPTLPPHAKDQYAGNFSPGTTAAFASAAWGWHLDTATHAVRLILSGVFDRYPRLQVIIGHMGEVLPVMLPRLEQALPVQISELHRPVGDYMRQNLHYTFSGIHSVPAFLALFLQIGADRIMFSTDYPYGSLSKAKAFLDHLPASAVDRDRIAHRNAEELLRL
ncbi:amidohydrolase family protein [Micromonospora sp. NPDC051196]|uniref:amidohydrolase family protein n=1 Tax=Micromonospora sp. NPDC051196 TaxID=3155281 RepID=UPI0034313784